MGSLRRMKRAAPHRAFPLAGSTSLPAALPLALRLSTANTDPARPPRRRDPRWPKLAPSRCSMQARCGRRAAGHGGRGAGTPSPGPRPASIAALPWAEHSKDVISSKDAGKPRAAGSILCSCLCRPWERGKESCSGPARCHQVPRQTTQGSRPPTAPYCTGGSQRTLSYKQWVTAVTVKGEKSDKAYFYKLQLGSNPTGRHLLGPSTPDHKVHAIHYFLH